MYKPKTHNEFQQMLANGKKFVINGDFEKAWNLTEGFRDYGGPVSKPALEQRVWQLQETWVPGKGNIYELMADGNVMARILVIICASHIQKVEWAIMGPVATIQNISFDQIEFTGS